MVDVDVYDDATPRELTELLFKVMNGDRDRLMRIDNYMQGNHPDPYMPQTADAEYALLARRAITNWMPLVVGTPAQALYVDGFVRFDGAGDVTVNQQGELSADEEIMHWNNSRLPSRQMAIYRAALTFGHSFTLTTKRSMRGDERVLTKSISPLDTSAVFEDPANDDVPYAALHIIERPSAEREFGSAYMWKGEEQYKVRFRSLTDMTDLQVSSPTLHGARCTPVTRFAADVDTEGRTTGVIEPLMAVQDRINQTVFDLLVAQTFASFKVRTVTGMAPPIKRDASGNPILDENGNYQPLDVQLNARRQMWAEDPDVRFGTLDHTPLDGYIQAIQTATNHLAALSQTPPHYLLGHIVNLSADALTAAELGLTRLVEKLRYEFGQSWKCVMTLAADYRGETLDKSNFDVLWRDMSGKSMVQQAEALGILSEKLGVPSRALWERVPGITSSDLARWDQYRAEDSPEDQLANGFFSATDDSFQPFSEVSVNDNTGT